MEKQRLAFRTCSCRNQVPYELANDAGTAYAPPERHTREPSELARLDTRAKEKLQQS